MKKSYYLISIVALLSSCTTMTKTANTADITSSLQSATVADLDVQPRISYTMAPSKAVRRGGLDNIKRTVMSEALERNGAGDVLVNPEFTISKRRGLFSTKVTSVTVTGRPATYTNIRSFDDSVWCNPVFRGIVAARKHVDINPSIPKAVTPKPKAENRKPMKEMTWMIRVGAGSNKFVGADDGIEVGGSAGYSVGIEFNRAIKRKGAYWGMDFTFARRGYEADWTSGNIEAHEEFKAHYFQYAPVLFGWKIRMGQSDFSIDPHIGFFVSYDIGGSYKSNKGTSYQERQWIPGYGSNYYAGHYEYVTRYSYDNEEGDVFDGDAGEHFDVGLKFGIGVWYKNKYNADFTVQRGFLEPGYTDFVCNGSLNLMFRLGYAF